MKIENENGLALYDPGANISMIKYDFFRKLKNAKMIKKGFTFKTMSGGDRLMGVTALEMKIINVTKIVRLFVIDKKNLRYDVVIGLDNIPEYGLRLNERLELSQKKVGNEREGNESKNESEDEMCVNWNEFIPVHEFEARTSHLDEKKRKTVYELIDKHGACFAKDRYDIGKVTKYEAHIKLSENRYVARKPYRCSFTDQQEIESQVAELLKRGMIEQSTSPFASPVTLAYKKEGEERVKNRMCVDFRELNKLVVPESQPFPLIEDLITRTQGCKWFSSLDINSAFWTIPIRQKDRYKTAFVTQHGHWEFKSLPFGYKNAPAIFQRILSGIIRKRNLEKFCVNYIDDILVFSRSFEEHISHIEELLCAIQEEGFRLKFTKCEFAKDKVTYLGHVVGNGTVRPLTNNVIAIREFPKPKNRKNIRQFLGKVNFYLKYIPNATRLLDPLHNLLRKDVRFEWSERCEEAFVRVKEYLATTPVLAIFDHSKPIHIYSDASIEGLGAVLKQPQEDGSEKPVAYFSRKLNEYQKKKKAIYIECMAIREAVRYWQFWLIGKRFKVFSDHKPLENLKIKARTDEELGDLIHSLLQYDFDVVYKPGPTNIEADCLSRNPVLEPDESQLDEKICSVNTVTLDEIRKDQSGPEIETIKKVQERNNLKYVRVKDKWKVVISENLGRELIRRTHEKYGHVGAKHVRNILMPYYFFKGMTRNINQICTSCEVCIRNKTRIRSEKGIMGHLGPAREPYEIMALDTIGGLGGKRSKKKYLHLLVDHFSRYAFILTSSGQSAKDFEKLVSRVDRENHIGLLLTDQYGGLCSKEFSEFLKGMRTAHMVTAVDHAASNGLNERLNQTIVNRIRCRMNEGGKKKNWATVANQCVKEYNETIHSVTGFAPNYLLHGILPETVPMEIREQNDFQKDRKLAFINSLKDHERNKENAKPKGEIHEFEVGDMVFIENGNKLNREKLDEIRIGPYEIVEKRSSSVYGIKVNNNKTNNTRLYHRSKMIPYDRVLGYSGSEGMHEAALVRK